MAVVRLTFLADQVGPTFERQGQAALAAAREAAEDVLAEGILAGREDISSAPGRFGTRWWMGLKGNITESGGVITVRFTHDIPYFWVHQEGATIVAKRGRSVGGVPQMWFEDTRSSPFRLVHVPRVTIPKRFRTKEAIIAAMREFPEFYRKRRDEQSGS